MLYKMATTASTKRTRASNEQLSQMVDFISNHPGLGGGEFQRRHGKLECDKKWRELTSVLNALGREKTVDQWHTVWRDLKSRTGIKVRNRKNQAKWGGEVSTEPITELERRVIAIAGIDDVNNHDAITENVIVKQELDLDIEEGEGEEFIRDMPSSSSTREETPELRYDTSYTPYTTAKTRIRGKRKQMEEQKETRTKFLKIAQNHAESLKMLAESSAANVEVANKQADALKLLAECSAANLEANKMISEAIKAMGESLRASTDAFNNLAKVINRLSAARTENK